MVMLVKTQQRIGRYNVMGISRIMLIERVTLDAHYQKGEPSGLAPHL